MPAEYLRHEVLVRWNGRTVRIFEQKQNRQIAIHRQSEPGRFNTDSAHIPQAKIDSLEKGPKWLMERVIRIGEGSTQWAHSMLKNRGIQGYRTLQGLLQLARKHSADELNRARSRALDQQAYHLRHIRQQLKQPAQQPQLNFSSSHPQIRDLSYYQNLIPQTPPKGDKHP